MSQAAGTKGKAGSKEHFSPPHDLGGDHGPAHAEEGEGNWLVSYADMMTLLVGFFVILLSFAKVDEEKFDMIRKMSIEFGGTYEVPFSDTAERLKKEMERLGKGEHFTIKQTARGIEISFKGTMFFDTGSAELKADATDLLGKIIPMIKSESIEFNVTVEGHTDDVPITTTIYRNNWELSGARACRVLERFESSGFEKRRLLAVGYGETRPVVPNRDPSGVAIPANQSLNRRVVIKLIKPEAPSLGPQDETEVPNPG